MFGEKTKIWIIIFVTVILAVVWLIWGNSSSNSSSTNLSGIQVLGELAGETKKVEEEPSFLGRIFGGSGETYRDSTDGFSFKYSSEYSIKEFPPITEDEGRTLLLSKEGSAPSIQIVVSDFDEDIVLTSERILTDVPDFPMDNPRAINIAGTKGVSFGTDAGISVWFVAKNRLFQLTALSSEIPVFEGIISSFKY